MSLQQDAKTALDKIIDKARIHFYKPIQIAEILYYNRTHPGDIHIENLESYRNPSKKWRDEISIRLVGRFSTSSQKYQDNVFEENAMPPRLLKVLSDINTEYPGMVECYIYHRFKQRLQDVLDAHAYVVNSAVEAFSLSHFLNFYEYRPGLRRSVDKAYEIVVYALFSTLVKKLDARISLTLENPDRLLLQDFSIFIHYVLGISLEQPEISFPAQLYRTGVTNAADTGLDILANYGLAVQVKHVQLTEEIAGDMSTGMPGTDTVIVCRRADAPLIKSLLSQIGLRIRGIITQDDLENWYTLCQQKYTQELAKSLLDNLRAEFEREFPMLNALEPFLEGRGYTSEVLQREWALNV